MTTTERLDTLTDEYRADRGEPDEACRYGHFGCSYRDGGRCEGEEVARLVARDAETELTDEELRRVGYLIWVGHDRDYALDVVLETRRER